MWEEVQKSLDAIRPYLQADGGDIELVEIEDGVVKVRLQGACQGCPGAKYTLEMGVLKRLQADVPAVVGVESVA